MKKSIIIILLLSLAFGAQAQAQAQKQWTLRDCIDYAVENNLDVKQQRISVESSANDLNTVINSRLPSVSASAGQSFGFGRSRSIATEAYENVTSSGTSYSVGASMTLFQGGRVNNQIKSGRLGLEATEESFRRVKEDLSLGVALSFMEVLFQKELAALADERVSLTSQQLAQTEIMVAEQSVSRSQLYDMQAQLANDELGAVNAHNALAMALLDLAQIINLPNTDGFDISIPDTDDAVAIYAAGIRTPEDIFATAVGIKPIVREAELRLLGSEIGVKIARSVLSPSVSIGLSHGNGFNHSLESGVKNPSIITQLRNNRSESVGLSVSIPLFNQFSTRNGIRNARLSVASRQIDLQEIKNKLFKDIQQAHQGAVSAQAKYTASEKAQEAAAEAYRHAVARYEEAMSTPFELNDALNKLMSSRSNQLQAKYEFLFRVKILDFYRGVEIGF